MTPCVECFREARTTSAVRRGMGLQPVTVDRTRLQPVILLRDKGDGLQTRPTARKLLARRRPTRQSLRQS